MHLPFIPLSLPLHYPAIPPFPFSTTNHLLLHGRRRLARLSRLSLASVGVDAIECLESDVDILVVLLHGGDGLLCHILEGEVVCGG
jgi:hypothetical protein